MVLALILTFTACSLLLIEALRRIDRRLTPALDGNSKERAPEVLGCLESGYGSLALVSELLLASGLAVRPPPPHLI